MDQSLTREGGWMDFVYLFTSLQGRINRAKWWTGNVILFAIGLIPGLIIIFNGPATTTSNVINTLVYILLVYPGYALAAKRFQDRDKVGTTALYGYIPSYIATSLLVFSPEEQVGPGVPHAWSTWTTLVVICVLVVIGIGIWFLIELGMLRGTLGPNRFGPDPLGRAGRAGQKA
jgi:uncharacterized membrane protein YhaH (DUF805 family)